MSSQQELEIKNKYTGEIIDRVPSDTPETIQAKIKRIYRNQEKLR